MRPAIDLVQLERLADVAGDQVVAEMIELFLAEATMRLTAVRNALARSDLEAARHSAHTLRGGASQIGAHELASLAHAIEIGTRTDIGQLARPASQLEPSWEAVAVQLERWLVERGYRRATPVSSAGSTS